MMTAKELIIHLLVLDLNHLDREQKDLRSKYPLLQDEPKFFYGFIDLCYLFNKNEFCISLKYIICVLEMCAS